MFEPFRKDLLAGKTTLITGGGSGLGRSMALRLAGLGAKVGGAGPPSGAAARRPSRPSARPAASPRPPPATCAIPRR